MMRIDLAKDCARLLKHLRQRVKDYPVYINAGPGEDEDPVQQITLGYQFDQAGWVVVVFDTRPDAQFDGEWNSYIEANALPFPRWQEAFETWSKHATPTEIVLADGSVKRLGRGVSEAKWARIFGNALRKALQDFAEAGGFKKVPRATGCFLAVEHHDGAFGWTSQKKEPDSSKALLTSLTGKSKTMPSAKRISHWVTVLDRLASGRLREADSYSLVCLVSKHAIEQLARLGAVMEMLEFVRSWSDKPEFKGDSPGEVEELAMQTPVIDVLMYLHDARWRCHEAEKVLQDILRVSCRANQRRKLWGILPLWAARCLRKHFKGYPDPEDSGSNELVNRAMFLSSAPLDQLSPNRRR